jgi:hypothetical protein
MYIYSLCFSFLQIFASTYQLLPERMSPKQEVSCNCLDFVLIMNDERILAFAGAFVQFMFNRVSWE